MAFSGAYEVAIKRGVGFVELAGTSAGAIAAALIAAGASPPLLRTLLQDLDFTRFLQPPVRRPGIGGTIVERSAALLGRTLHQVASIYVHEGIFSGAEIERWMEAQLRRVLPINHPGAVTFQQMPTPLWIIATDVETKGVKVWNSRTTPADSVAAAVRASCSIPGFFQPADDRYFDGGVLANLPTFVFSSGEMFERPIASRMLAFVLSSANRSRAAERPLRRLIDTVVDGNQQVQLSLQNNVPIINIDTGQVSATDFAQMTKETVATLISNGEKAANEFFDQEREHIQTQQKRSSVVPGLEELYSEIVQRATNCENLFISSNDTRFVYALFPTLLYLRAIGTQVQVVLTSADAGDRHDTYRRALLEALGCSIAYAQHQRQVFLFDKDDVNSASAYVRILSATDSKKAEAVRYAAPLDAEVISTLRDALQAPFKGSTSDTSLPYPYLEPIRETEVLDRLRKSPQYRDPQVRLSYDVVSSNRFWSLTRHAREFKLLNIRLLHKVFTDAHILPFSPARVKLATGTSIVTPPVAERVGDKLVLIEGTSRAMFCREMGLTTLPCVIAENVSAPLPSQMVSFDRVRLAGRTLPTDVRYVGFDYMHFRHIESIMHTIDDLKD